MLDKSQKNMKCKYFVNVQHIFFYKDAYVCNYILINFEQIRREINRFTKYARNISPSGIIT